MGGEATRLFRGNTPRLLNYGIKTGSQVGEVIIHHKGGDPAFLGCKENRGGMVR